MFYRQRRSVCLYLAVIMAFCGILAGFDQFEPSFAMSAASDDVRVEQSITSLSEKLLCTSETKGSGDIVRSLEKNHQVLKCRKTDFVPLRLLLLPETRFSYTGEAEPDYSLPAPLETITQYIHRSDGKKRCSFF